MTINTQLLLNLYLSFPLSAWKQKGPLSKDLMLSISKVQFPFDRSPNIFVRPLKWSSTRLWPLWKITPPVFLDQMPRVRGTCSGYWKVQGITTQERVRAVNLKGTSAARTWNSVKRQTSHDGMTVENLLLITWGHDGFERILKYTYCHFHEDLFLQLVSHILENNDSKKLLIKPCWNQTK